MTYANGCDDLIACNSTIWKIFQWHLYIKCIYKQIYWSFQVSQTLPDSKVYGTNTGPTWALSVPDGPHVGPMNLAIRAIMWRTDCTISIKTIGLTVAELQTVCPENDAHGLHSAVVCFLFITGPYSSGLLCGGWGCEVSCGGHHRLRGKTTTGSALDGAVFDIAQILAYLVHNMSRSQLYLEFGHFGWLPSFFGQ